MKLLYLFSRQSLFILNLLFILPLSLFSQELKPHLKDSSANSDIFLLSHLEASANKDSCLNLSNYYDYQNPMKLFRFSERADSSYCQTLEQIGDIYANTKSSEAFVLMIHGAGKTLKEAVSEAKEVKKLYGVNVLIYNWPAMVGNSYDTKNLKGIKAKVDEGIDRFAELLILVEQMQGDLQKEGRNTKWTLFLHSIGNYFLESAVLNNKLPVFEKPLFENVILNAAAVDSRGHALWLEKIKLQKRIYVNSNKKDMILKGLKYLTQAKTQLGSKAILPLANNAFYVDFTSAIGKQKPVYKSHSYYFKTIAEQSDALQKYYSIVFRGEEVEWNNNAMFIPNPKNRIHTILY